MLKIWIGTDWVANRNAVMDRIASDVKNREGGRILIVPEMISHGTERLLCEAAGDTASRYAEVLTFTRLEDRVCEYTGIGMPELLDGGGQIVAMAAAARSLHSRIKVFAGMDTKPEFLEELLHTVEELKQCCIRPENLRFAAAQLEGALAQKLEDLALLYETYDSVCSQGKRDPGSRMDYLLEELQTSDYCKTHTFYVDGFPDFTAAHMQVLEQIILDAEYTCVSLCTDGIGSESIGFEKSGQTAAMLISFAKRNRIAYEVGVIPPRQSPLMALYPQVLQHRAEEILCLSGRVTAYEADSVREECCAALERINELVRDGWRYRDIAIVCGDLSVYRPTLTMLAQQYRIPIFLAGKEDILQNPVISTVLSALNSAVDGFLQEDMFRYIKSALSPVSEDEADYLENYAVVWGITGKQWEERWEHHPDGMDAQWSEEVTARMETINRVRETLMAPLSHLRSSFLSAACVSDQVQGVFRFLDEIGYDERLKDMAEETGDLRQVQILNQLWEILLGALEQMEDTIGTMQWEDENFTRLLSLLLSRYHVGTIPATLDCVQVGALTDLRCVHIPHLLILGANEGAFPAYPDTSGLLNDRERRTLNRCGVAITGTGLDALEAEFAYLYGLFCGVEETITISSDPASGSSVFRRIAEASGGVKPFPAVLGTASCGKEQAGAFLAAYSMEETAEQLGLKGEYDAASTQADYRLGTLERSSVEGLYGRKLRLSASQIDRVASCKLAFFLQYGLRAKQRKEATIDPAAFGTYVHEVLEKTASEVATLGGFRQVSLEKTMEIADKHAKSYVQAHFSELNSERNAYLLARNEREMKTVVEDLWKELSRSLFDPRFFELEFGEGKALEEINITGAKMQALVRGVVDRVDVYEKDGCHYFRVVDYKTGRKTFDYCDVENGVGLQMLLYLFALKNQGNSVIHTPAVPGGVLYFPARIDVLSQKGKPDEAGLAEERQKQRKRSGLLLADDTVLGALDQGAEGENPSVYRDKKGNLNVDTADRKQWDQLERFLGDTLRQLVNTIADGCVDADPYTRGDAHNPCSYCAFSTICHSDTVPGRRNRKAIKDKQFWEDLDKVVKRNG